MVRCVCVCVCVHGACVALYHSSRCSVEASSRAVPWFEYYFRWKELCGNTFISPVLWPRFSSWISNSLLMISPAENPWPLITFNLRRGKIGPGGWGGGGLVGETHWREIKKNNIFFFSTAMCVGGLLFVPRCEEKQKGLLGHWLTYSGFSFLSPPLMAVFSSLSIMGPIISSSFSLSSSWMISISLTGSTVPSTWMISSSSKAPAETGHVTRLYRISDFFTAGTRQQGQRVKTLFFLASNMLHDSI